MIIRNKKINCSSHSISKQNKAYWPKELFAGIVELYNSFECHSCAGGVRKSHTFRKEMGFLEHVGAGTWHY